MKESGLLLVIYAENFKIRAGAAAVNGKKVAPRTVLLIELSVFLLNVD